MFSFKIPANDLHRMVYNAKLLDVRSHVTFRIENGFLTVAAYDGFEVIEDTTEINFDPTPGVNWTLDYKESKLLEVALRDELNELECSIEPGAFVVGGQKYIETGMLSSQGTATHVGAVLFDKTKWLGPTKMTFDIHPSRARKFPLLKPADYPLSCMVVTHTIADRDILLYKKGPSLRGAILTLDRTLLPSDTPLW